MTHAFTSTGMFLVDERWEIPYMIGEWMNPNHTYVHLYPMTIDEVEDEREYSRLSRNWELSNYEEYYASTEDYVTVFDF